MFMRDLDSSSRLWRPLALVASTLVVSGAVLIAGAPQAAPPAKPKPAAAAAAAPAMNPNPPGASIYLTVVRIKPSSWDDYVALQKSDAMPALQKGGRAARQAWRTQGFGQAYEVAYLYPMKSWAEIDDTPPIRKALGPDGEKAYNAKVRPMVESAHSYALRERPDLGFVADQSARPKLGILAHIQVIPGKQAAFEAILKNEWSPLLKKAGVPLYGVYEVTMGGAMGEFYTFTPIENFAALDAGHPILKVLTPAQYHALAVKIGAVVSQVDRTIDKLDEDLTYGPMQ
jgi:hypothetical protein